jgi:ribosomal protein L44E
LTVLHNPLHPLNLLVQVGFFTTEKGSQVQGRSAGTRARSFAWTSRTFARRGQGFGDGKHEEHRKVEKNGRWKILLNHV